MQPHFGISWILATTFTSRFAFAGRESAIVPTLCIRHHDKSGEPPSSFSASSSLDLSWLFSALSCSLLKKDDH
ncbi:hypothetical protein QOT17_018243 [Balamuthia mandrillaris]